MVRACLVGNVQLLKGVVTLSGVPKGSKVHFLVKGVFSPMSPCLGNICLP